MNRFMPPMRACALASVILLGAAPALAQQESADAEAAPDADKAQPSAPAGSQLPGVVLERNVFVPVDAAGKPASNQFIVVERRTLAKGDSDADTSSDSAATSDVPTRFILVPQEAGDDSADEGSGAAPR